MRVPQVGVDGDRPLQFADPGDDVAASDPVAACQRLVCSGVVRLQMDRLASRADGLVELAERQESGSEPPMGVGQAEVQLYGAPPHGHGRLGDLP